MIGYEAEKLTMTILPEDGSILLSGAVLAALDHPRQVQMLINEQDSTLLIKACTENDREAIVIPPMVGVQFGMSGTSLIRRIRKLTGWADELPRMVIGNYLPRYRVIVFDMHTAVLAEIVKPAENRMN